MKKKVTESVGTWLQERCKEQGLSLRQAAAKTGLSHATIAAIIKSGRPSPETVKRLVHAFSGDGNNQRTALEDKLLVLAGIRARPYKEKIMPETTARLLDIISNFDEVQLKLVSDFASYLGQVAKGKK